MRLQEVYLICQKMRDGWKELSFEEKKVSGGGVCYKLANLTNVNGILDLASNIPSFETVVTNIKSLSPGFVMVGGEVIMDSRGKNTLITEFSQLKLKATTIADLFDSFEYKQNDNGFDIKLPPNISLADLSKCSRDLDLIFSSCPLLSKIDGTIALSSVDVGSIWLSFVIGGTAITAVLTMIATLVDKALIIRSHYLTTKTQMETYRTLKVQNDMLEHMEENFETVNKMLVEKYCTELCEQYDVKDPEDFERMKNSLNLLSD